MNNIYCSLDDVISFREEEDDQMYFVEFPIEIKCTALGLDNFNPWESVPEWIERIAGYAKVLETTTIGLVVFFVSGNMSDYLPWAAKKQGGTPRSYFGIALRAWQFDLRPSFIVENWDIMLKRKKALQIAVEKRDPSSLNAEMHRKRDWMCKTCQYNNICSSKSFELKEVL